MQKKIETQDREQLSQILLHMQRPNLKYEPWQSAVILFCFFIDGIRAFIRLNRIPKASYAAFIIACFSRHFKVFFILTNNTSAHFYHTRTCRSSTTP